MSQVIDLDGCAIPCVHPDTVLLARDTAPDPDQVARVSAIFKLLGDPTRTRLLYALLEAGEMCVCDQAAATDTLETTVSQSLRLLRAASVVTGRRSGRNVYYRLLDAHVRMLLDLTREHARHDIPHESVPHGSVPHGSVPRPAPAPEGDAR